MRILICLLVVTSSVLAAQTSQDLHSRYSEPDRERFVPRPDIALTVEYGPDHMVCGALLVPPATQPLLTQRVPEKAKGRADQLELYVGGQEPPQYMTSDAVSEILEQLAPTASRGEKLRSSVTVSGCNQISFTEYANVSIMRSTHNCHPEHPNRDIRASLKFKRDECHNETLGRHN